MITRLPAQRISAISQWKTFIRVLPTRWRRKRRNCVTVTLCIGPSHPHRHPHVIMPVSLLCTSMPLSLLANNHHSSRCRRRRPYTFHFVLYGVRTPLTAVLWVFMCRPTPTANRLVVRRRLRFIASFQRSHFPRNRLSWLVSAFERTLSK